MATCVLLHRKMPSYCVDARVPKFHFIKRLNITANAIVIQQNRDEGISLT